MVDVVSNANGDNRITVGSGTEKGKGVGGKGGERVHRVNYFPKCRANQVMLSGVLHLRARLQRAHVVASKNAVQQGFLVVTVRGGPAIADASNGQHPLLNRGTVK